MQQCTSCLADYILCCLSCLSQKYMQVCQCKTLDQALAASYSCLPVGVVGFTPCHRPESSSLRSNYSASEAACSFFQTCIASWSSLSVKTTKLSWAHLCDGAVYLA